jgi:hypothetical protein
MYKSCTDDFFVDKNSLCLLLYHTETVEQDPSSPSFPQPKINLGTFHFLEKRVQYRISKGFK